MLITIANILTDDELTTARALLDIATWGSGLRDSGSVACNGVFIDWSDIKITHNGAPGIGEGEIARNANSTVTNIFTVTPHNDSVDQSGTYIAANDVRATFRIRNYGLGLGPQQYELVGTTGGNLLAPNPTAPINIPASVPPALGSATATTNNWKLNAAQQTNYINNPHQCILAELDGPALIIRNDTQIAVDDA